jgi:hypothetical protein
MFALLRKQKLLLEGHFAEISDWWNDELGLRASFSRWCQSCDCVQQSTQVGSLRDKTVDFRVPLFPFNIFPPSSMHSRHDDGTILHLILDFL